MLPRTPAVVMEMVQQLLGGEPILNEDGKQIGVTPSLITQKQALDIIMNYKIEDTDGEQESGSVGEEDL